MQTMPSDGRPIARGDSLQEAVDQEIRPPPRPAVGMPVNGSLALARALSLLIACLVAVVSVVGLTWPAPGLYGTDWQAASGISTSTAGVVVPGFRAHDAFN